MFLFYFYFSTHPAQTQQAIPLGVTNVSEVCMWMESANKVYGRSNNAYNTNHTVGGSSGGEGTGYPRGPA
jgi:fatty acid amide hydrolase 2